MSHNTFHDTSHDTLTNTLTYPVEPQRCKVITTHDHVQIALAIADTHVLKSLLVDCTPPLARAEHIGAITSKIGIPVESRKTVDGMIQFESLHCILVNSPAEIEERVAATTEPQLRQREYLKLTRCESEMQTLGHALTLAQTLAILTQAGFSDEQIDKIVNLPNDAWHKTWWYSLDDEGNFTVPFLRMMRTLRYPDGTFTLQYRDHFAQDKPRYFTSQEHKVMIEIRTEAQTFHKTLERINVSRVQLGIEKALLICDSISELEARGFISQGISVYATQKSVALATQSDCTACANYDCPMNGRSDSPVLTCRQFCYDAS
jgi:hypothetical protein